MIRRPVLGMVCCALGLSIATTVVNSSPVHAATITVTSGGDSGSGTLRAALAAASSGDTITFAPSVTDIELTSGELSVSTGVTITGPGADVLTVRRSSAGGTPSFRIFMISPGASETVSISGLTISNGDATPGGGIGFSGSSGTALNLVRIAVVGNNGMWGGGIDVAGDQSSSVLIDSSTVSANTTNNGTSCGFCNAAGMKAEVPTTIVNSTFSGNISGDNGGGIKVDSDVTIVNSTFAGNSATGQGGGIWVTSFNHHPDLVLKNTLVADNTAGAGHHECDVSPSNTTLSVNLNNLIEDGSCNFLWASGATSGTATGFLSGDPALTALALNGASTRTHAIGEASAAFGSGDDATCGASPVGGVDQRGETRGTPCSIGAFDVSSSSATTTPSSSGGETSGSTTVPADSPSHLAPTGANLNVLVVLALVSLGGGIFAVRRRFL